MRAEEEILVSPELSHDFTNFEELCSENGGSELPYLEMSSQNPLEIDPATLAFSMRHVVRMSRELLDLVLGSLNEDSSVNLGAILDSKGIQLDKNHADALRRIIFAFRDSENHEVRETLTRAFQLIAMSRERHRITLNLEESYTPAQEGWTEEDFGGDETLLETVRAIEDPHWIRTEEK